MSALKKILLIDDDADLREALADQLVLTEEFDVFEAESGADGVTRAKDQLHDLIILDVGLPDMDGREVCRLLRKSGVRCPVVMLTGWLLVQFVGDPGGSNPLLELVLGSRDPLALILLAFTAVVLAPLFEETIFRGALLPVLGRRFGPLPGVLLSGLLFGMAHISIGELAPLTVLGVGLGRLRVSSGRLLPCVLMHGTWNAVTFLNLLLL